MKRKVSIAAAISLLALATFVAVTQASPPSGVTATVLARGTYEPFRVKSPPHSHGSNSSGVFANVPSGRRPWKKLTASSKSRT